MSQLRGKTANSALGKRTKTKRKWLTFLRVCRYGIENFSRNAWLTTAATAIMVVTLLIISSTLIARNVFADTLQELRQKVDVSVYLRDDLSEQQREGLISLFKQQPIVTDVLYVSKEQARKEFQQDDARSLEELQALTEIRDNPLPASLTIKVSDPSKLSELDPIINSDRVQDAQYPGLESTAAGEKRASLDTIAKAASFTERAGLLLCVIAIIISILIIFNTIRMAIFNRRDEIQMMKLIGADKNFIQNPFIVEAVMYGIFAAVITTAIIYPLILTQADIVAKYGVVTAPTVSFLTHFPLLVVLLMVIIGALIGVVSSLLAIRRYLKV